MTFRKCSIRGKTYGYVYDEHGTEIQDPTVKRSFFSFSFSIKVFKKKKKLESIELIEQDKDLTWYDQKLLDAIESNDPDVHQFFILLSLCHTVMPEDRDGRIIYQAQSPDENALVSASRSFGFAFLVKLFFFFHIL